MYNIKLFCLPYAGGSATVYHRWGKYLDSAVELCPIELAGRGMRFSEPCYNDFNETVEDLYQIISSQLGQGPFAFFGHSMGSLLTYALVHKLKRNGYQEPMHIFFSGRYPPHIMKDRDVHLLPDEEFKKEIFKYGGTPKGLMENEDLLKVFLPILRADYKVINTYNHESKDEKIQCSFSILNGKQDFEVINYNMDEWKDYTSGECYFYEFDGGHFYINDKVEEITEIINDTLILNQAAF